MLSDPSGNYDELELTLNQYLSLLMGVIFGPPELGQSKLRHLIRFKWTHSLLGTTPSVHQDALFELISMCQEYGLWLTKHAAMISSKDDVKIDDAKKVHQCLKKAAGVFLTMDKEYVPRLIEKGDPGSDLDSRVATAYVKQCLAEAQEITIARAIELKHAPSLISSLAAETSRTFLSGASSIKALDPSIAGKWMKYFTFKSAFYDSYVSMI